MNAGTYEDKAIQVLDHLCTATAVSQRGPVVTVTFEDTGHAYRAYQVMSDALEHECAEVQP